MVAPPDKPIKIPAWDLFPLCKLLQSIHYPTAAWLNAKECPQGPSLDFQMASPPDKQQLINLSCTLAKDYFPNQPDPVPFHTGFPPILEKLEK